MKKELHSIMLIDDDIAANYFHKIIIEDSQICDEVKIFQSALEALEYLNSLKQGNLQIPDLILLDINMPRLDGWQFIEEYGRLDQARKDEIKVVMLTTSSNPRDRERAMGIEEIVDLIHKPLSVEKLQSLQKKYYT
ncbi:MAG: response regulator [Bacteroidota bacterium]